MGPGQNGEEPLRAQLKRFNVMTAHRQGQYSQIDLTSAQPVHQMDRNVLHHGNGCLRILAGKQGQRQRQEIRRNRGNDPDTNWAGNGRLLFRYFFFRRLEFEQDGAGPGQKDVAKTVSRTVRPSRSNRRTPSSSSSFMICCDSEGCATCSCSAARVKLPVSATAQK